MSRDDTALSRHAPAFTDRSWQQLWDQTLSQPERHRLAVALFRREVPEDRLGRRVVPELARRWRGQCVVLALGWVVWVGFWLLMVVAELRSVEAAIARGDADMAQLTGLPLWCVGVGVLVITGSLLARHWFRPLARWDRSDGRS